LGDFFLNRRFQSKKNKKFPLRDDALRTPEHAFVAVPDFSHQSSYISDLPSLDGLRMHYVDSGPEENKSAWLCLHGPSSWSFVFQSFLNSMPESERVILIDMIGFGKSDKPKREKFHQLQQHRLILRDFVDRLGLKSINVVVDGWHSGFLMSLCEGISPLICSFLVLPEGPGRLSIEEFDGAIRAPFPGKGYKAGIREFSRLLLEFKKEKNPDFQNN
jgi:tRNA(adenine34) deaminase